MQKPRNCSVTTTPGLVDPTRHDRCQDCISDLSHGAVYFNRFVQFGIGRFVGGVNGFYRCGSWIFCVQLSQPTQICSHLLQRWTKSIVAECDDLDGHHIVNVPQCSS